MPYDVGNPPDAISKLPKHAQEIWVAAYNSAYEQYDGDEAKSNGTAWAAVKKAYKQDAEGNWVALSDKLETVDVKGVEVLSVGKWDSMQGPANITQKDLEELERSFAALLGDSKLNYEPPVKLGHDDGQKLLQKDGYPAAGWISALRIKGKKLVADFKDVPKKIGDIVNAGGYKKVSSEITRQYSIGGKVWPVVLRAISLLGGDIPAVKTLDDIKATYSEDEGGETIIYEFGEPKTDLERVMSHYNVPKDVAEKMLSGVKVDDILPPRGTKVNAGEPFSLQDIATGLDEWLQKAEDSIKGKQGSPAIRTFVKEVKARLKALLEKEAHTENNASSDESGDDLKNQEKEATMLKELQELYGLPEDATEEQVLEAVRKSKELGEAKATTQLEETTQKVTSLEEKIKLQERDALVDKYVKAGKITPAQKEQAEKIALSDPEGFKVFFEAQPVIVKLGEVGAEGGDTNPQVTDKELQIAEAVGNTPEELMTEKKAMIEEGVA